MQEGYDILIVGAGHAGAHAAIALRQNNYAGTIAIVGSEPELPYERPPLSKDYLSGEKAFERILIRPASFWDDKMVVMRLGEEIVAVDPVRHVAVTAVGIEIHYGTLIWAAGGIPRQLTCSGHGLIGVHSVRSRADVDRMTAELPAVERVCVIGGGYVGLEAAAVLVKLGKCVTVLEALPRVLARVAGEALSRFYEAEHRAHGVDVRLGVSVDCIEERDGHVYGVRLADGDVVPCDMVIVGIGIIPAVQPLLDAGAEGGNGVQVDEYCRTGLPDIYAIGDCAAHDNLFADSASIRLESVQNANDQAIVVAKALTGTTAPYAAVPWFWSHQYDLRLQTIGLSSGHDQVALRGSPSERSFSLVYLKGGKVIALDCVNRTKDYVQGRALVLAKAALTPEELTDPGVQLKDLLVSAAK